MKAKIVAIVSLLLLATVPGLAQGYSNEDHGQKMRHVLLISIDGMHSLDFVNCMKGISGVNNDQPYCPSLAALSSHGVNYLNASASRPSDSFPGLMAIVTGGSPRTVGAFYDVAYDRVLAPPAQTTGNGVAGGTCTPGVPNGTTTEYEEGIDFDQSQLNGGGDFGKGSINPQFLPRDPFHNCQPVYPWNFVRTNTIFGVVHKAGGFTAWSDKHPAYASVAGPGDGSNLDDFFAPEINSNVVALPVTTATGMPCTPVPDQSQLGSYTDSFQNVQCYDTVKVNAIVNEIHGKTLRGNTSAPVPTLFGMNFQAVSVGQKLIEKNVGKGGYIDAAGTPSSFLLRQIQFVDASIGRMIAELKKNGLYETTLIVVTAKHGQSPIDSQQFFPIPGKSGTNGNSPATILDGLGLLPSSESPSNPTGIGPTEDDISLLWLNDSSKTGEAVSALEAHSIEEGVGEIFYGAGLLTMFNAPGLPPSGDPRTPDIIVSPKQGVVYTGSSKKQAEHGGFSQDDTNVILLISNPSLRPKMVNSSVETTQVAPTILKSLGLEPSKLDSVRVEGTPVLPGVKFDSEN